MADSDVIRKLHVYRALFRLNRAFAHIAHNLDWLTLNRILVNHIPSDMPGWWVQQLEEIQAEINRRLTETLHNLEHGDVKRLGRIVEMAPEIRALYFQDEEQSREGKRKKSRKIGNRL